MNKFRTYAFWIALSSAVVILVQSLGKLFGFEVESDTIENVIMSICGVLVVLGIITKTGTSEDACVKKEDECGLNDSQGTNNDDILDNDELYVNDAGSNDSVDIVDNIEINTINRDNDNTYNTNCD